MMEMDPIRLHEKGSATMLQFHRLAIAITGSTLYLRQAIMSRVAASASLLPSCSGTRRSGERGVAIKGHFLAVS